MARPARRVRRRRTGRTCPRSVLIPVPPGPRGPSEAVHRGTRLHTGRHEGPGDDVRSSAPPPCPWRPRDSPVRCTRPRAAGARTRSSTASGSDVHGRHRLPARSYVRQLPALGRRCRLHRRRDPRIEAVPFPDADVNPCLAGHFQSVQSVVLDPADRLWILARAARCSPVPPTAARSRWRLADDPLVPPDPDFLPVLDGEAFMNRPAGAEPTSLRGRFGRDRHQRRRRTPPLPAAVRPPTAERVGRRARRFRGDRGGGGRDRGGPRAQVDGRRTGERRQGAVERRRPGARRPLAPQPGRHVRHLRPGPRAGLGRHPLRRLRRPRLRHGQPAQPPGPVPRGRGPAPQVVSPRPCAGRSGPGEAATAHVP